MSGPIVRKYGFPNFEKIFGERPLEHGVDEGGESAAGASTPASAPKAKAAKGKNAPKAGGKKKSKSN